MPKKATAPLTPIQKRVFNYITGYIYSHGYAPSNAEIASEFGFSRTSAYRHIQSLSRKGMLEKIENQPRGLALGSNEESVPLLGYIAAGEPIEPIENPEFINVPNSLLRDRIAQYYALRVRGDSMIDMGILDGDIVVIKHQFTANPGDIVVGITEKGATLKQFKIVGNRVALIPKNPNYQTIFPKKLEVRGKFVGLIRT